MQKMSRLFAIFFFSLSLLSACVTINTGPETAVDTNVTPIVLNQAQQPQQDEQPAQAAPAQPAQQQPADPEPPQDPTETPLPCNKAKFIAENIPDDKQYDPGDPFIKTWTIRNDGTCTWDETYRVVFNDGDRMSGESSFNLDRKVKPGETIDISVNLTAPAKPGTYQGYWNIKAPNGDLFTYFWAKIVVVDTTPPFAVTSVTTNLGSSYNPGACPLTIDLEVYITANGPGTVTYRPETSDLGMQGSDSITFTSAGTKTETFTWTITYSDSYWIKIHIDDPNNQTFGPFNFTVTCP